MICCRLQTAGSLHGGYVPRLCMTRGFVGGRNWALWSIQQIFDRLVPAHTDSFVDFLFGCLGPCGQ